MADLIEGVEAPKEGIVYYDDVIKVLEQKNISINTLKYLKELINHRDVLDMSGYSGNSTIIIPSSNNNPYGYCIKFADQIESLKSEKILLKFFSRFGLTSQYVDYIQDNGDILITEEIKKPWALTTFTTINEMAYFMGKTLRKFHDINWKKCDMTEEEKNVLLTNGAKIITDSLNHEDGLGFMADYQNDHNFNEMKNYIESNINDYKSDDVIIHGDYNPRNVYVKDNESAGFVDVTDSGFGDRHYDVYWTMWTISLYLGVQSDPNKVLECEKAFLSAYGKDKLDERRMTLCKKLNCMYWQENNDIRYFK